MKNTTRLAKKNYKRVGKGEKGRNGSKWEGILRAEKRRIGKNGNLIEQNEAVLNGVVLVTYFGITIRRSDGHRYISKNRSCRLNLDTKRNNQLKGNVNSSFSDYNKYIYWNTIL